MAWFVCYNEKKPADLPEVFFFSVSWRLVSVLSRATTLRKSTLLSKATCTTRHGTKKKLKKTLKTVLQDIDFPIEVKAAGAAAVAYVPKAFLSTIDSELPFHLSVSLNRPFIRDDST